MGLEYKHAADLLGQVAVVTGAGRGIGLAIAQALARHGATVVLAGRDGAVLAAAAAAINETQQRDCTSAVACDVSDPAAVRDLFQHVFKVHRRLDTLVANAGIMDDAPIGMVTPELIARVFGLSLIHI